MSIKTRKIKVVAIAGTKQEKTKIYNKLKSIASMLSDVGNRIIRVHVNNLYELEDLVNDKNLTKKEATDVLSERFNMSLQNVGYDLTKIYKDDVPSDIRTNFNQNIYKTLKSRFYDILHSKMSIPSFRSTNMSIPFSCDITTIKRDGDYYHLTLPSSRNDDTILKFGLAFGRDRSNNRVIVDRILSGEYIICNSNIKIEDKDFYLMLTYQQPDEQIVSKGNIMGIDLGINRPLSFYILGEKHQPRQIDLGLNIQHERLRYRKTKSSIITSMKYSKGGHGRKRKISLLDKMREKEKNWSKLMDNIMSKEIVTIAKRYGVGTIKIEDLTGITKNKNDYYFKSWSYYRLQEMIKQKAEAIGIKVIKVNPKDTSNTCPTCRNSDPLNRNDKDKTKFRCINNFCEDFDKEKDADIVAAFNITHSEESKKRRLTKKERMEKYQKENGLITP